MTEQPAPIKNTHQPVIDLVLEDLERSSCVDKVMLALVARDLVDRAELGRQRYGTLLQPHNGRNALLDAYEEALDLIMYTRQLLVERTGADHAYLAAVYEHALQAAMMLRDIKAHDERRS